MSNNNTSNVVNKVDEIKRALSSEKKAKNLQPIKTYGNLMDVVNKTNYEGNADFGDEDIANVAAVLLQLQIMNQSEVPDKPLPPMIPPSPNVQTFGRRMKLAKAKSPVNSADKVSDNASAKEDGNELSNSFQIMMDNFSEGKSLDTLTTKTLIDTRISIKRSSHAQSTSELSSKMPMEITSPLEQQKATSSQELVETRKKSSSQDSNLEIQRKHSQNLYDRVRKTSQDRARKDSQKSLENEESKPEMLIPHSEVEETALNNNPESPSKTPSTPWSRNEFTIDSPNSAIKSPGDDINQANRFMMPRLSSISRGSSSSKIEKVQFSSLPRNGNSMKSLNNLAPENAEGEESYSVDCAVKSVAYEFQLRSNNKVYCFDKVGRKYISGPGKLFPLDLYRVIYCEVSGRNVTVNYGPLKGSLNIGHENKMKDVVFEFVDKDLAASWSKRILLEAYTHRMDEVTAKKAVILVDSLDPKQPIDIVNKYVKSILDLAQKPSSVMMVDFSQVDLFYKALSYIDWKSTNCIVCVGSKIVLNPLELLFFETTRNHVGSSDIVSSFTNWNESDALELAISILKEPLGKKIAVACSNLHKRNSTNLITSLKNLSRGGMKSAASIERLDHQ